MKTPKENQKVVGLSASGAYVPLVYRAGGFETRCGLRIDYPIIAWFSLTDWKKVWRKRREFMVSNPGTNQRPRRDPNDTRPRERFKPSRIYGY